MKPTVAIALTAWPLVSVLLFCVLSPRRALIANFVVGWLFLPSAAIVVPGLPDISKATSMAVGALVGILLFDGARLAGYRPHRLDLAAVALVLAPFFASLSNGLGAYDGLSGMLRTLQFWGVPWLVGRLYGPDPRLLSDVLIGVVIGALAYVPICALEMRLSPQVNFWLYGFQSFDFHTTRRFGGYRPVGFLRHGIELGMLMMSASLTVVSFQLAGWRGRILGLPIAWVSGTLVVFTVLTRALGAWVLLSAGLFAVYLTRAWRRSILIVVLILAPFAYVGMRFSGAMPADALVSLAEIVSSERALSLRVRLENEDSLTAKAFERPIFGWGGWGRNRVYNERNEDTSLTDGLWIILFGQYGLVGVGSWLVILLAPPALALRRLGTSQLLLASSTPVLTTVVLIPLHMVNWLLNGFPNPISPMLAASLLSVRGPSRSRRAETGHAAGVPASRRARRSGVGSTQGRGARSRTQETSAETGSQRRVGKREPADAQRGIATDATEGP